jgi:hypothetical protein
MIPGKLKFANGSGRAAHEADEYKTFRACQAGKPFFDTRETCQLPDCSRRTLDRHVFDGKIRRNVALRTARCSRTKILRFFDANLSIPGSTLKDYKKPFAKDGNGRRKLTQQKKGRR